MPPEDTDHQSRKHDGFYRTIGEKGGQATKEKYGSEHFAQLGKKGGANLRDQQAAGYHAVIGSKGGSARRKSKKPTIPCPDCQDSHVVLNGIQRGHQYYRCNTCHKCFMAPPSTGTAPASSE